MTTRDIIVVGTSAGGVTALKEFVRCLPRDFAGSIFVVMHIPAYSESELPSILRKVGPLKAVHPKDGEDIEPVKIDKLHFSVWKELAASAIICRSM